MLREAAEARRVAVVVNTGSRRGAEHYGPVVRRLARTGLPVVTTHAVTDGAEMEPTLRQVIDADHDLIVVGGGDGTLSTAAGLLAGTDRTLGILPLGTANDFARTLHVPADPVTACHALAEGRVVDVDVGRVDGEPLLNVASVGLAVGVTEALTARLKKFLGPLAYPVATARAYRQHRPFRARLEFPDGDHEPVDLDDLLQVTVGNGRYYGGGNAISPTAGIDDHELDLVAIVRGSLPEHVTIARRLRDGTFVRHDNVHYLTTRRVRLSTDPPSDVTVDGEIAGTTPTLFTIERNALHVVVPTGSTAATLDGARARAD
ncbi:lipid kinase [Saccharomonospora iraqiensis]|uniref:lipid kinase n=1 Tax=Saccharomonospora iraqiensis TaxID=52698 RepID=UPI0009FCC2FB|nr:lipid kinase [Saccharomonospora iraqiensis]